MPTAISDKTEPVELPFTGRGKELARLKQLHAQRRHILILGPAGVGKSALIERIRAPFGLCICPNSERLSEICEALEREFQQEPGGLHLVRRKNRLLEKLKGTNRTVVFDGVVWTTPKLAGFIENVSTRAPVWICTRSEHPWDIGRVWPLLARFERVEIKPFHPAETRALIASAVARGIVPPRTADAADRLHHLGAGNPRMLCDLLNQLAGGRYDPRKKFDRRLLDLDRRIQQLSAPVV
jgi:hypothetical protein